MSFAVYVFDLTIINDRTDTIQYIGNISKFEWNNSK